MLGRSLKFTSFLITFLSITTILVCLTIYKFHSQFKLYPDLKWENQGKKIIKINNFSQKISFSSCPIFKIKNTFYKMNNKNISVGYYPFEIKTFFENIRNRELEYILFEIGGQFNPWCVKNYTTTSIILNKIPLIEKLLIKNVLNNEIGFSIVKNPFLYGEITISKSARLKATSNYVFKPLLISVSLLIFYYWFCILKIQINLKKNTNIFLPRIHIVLGYLSALCLILHVVFIDSNSDNELMKYFRKLVLVLFLIFEIFAQYIFIRSLNVKKLQIISLINPKVLFFKKCFVNFNLILLSIIAITIPFLNKNYVNMIEWNFFVFLSTFYLFTIYLWKKV